jgi:hypothetical protein
MSASTFASAAFIATTSASFSLVNGIPLLLVSTANALMGIQVATNRLITAANEMRAEAAVEKARRPLSQPTTRPITPWRPNAREECSSPCNVAPKPKQGVPWNGTLPESHITRFPSG